MNFSPRTRRGPAAPNAALSWREVTGKVALGIREAEGGGE